MKAYCKAILWKLRIERIQSYLVKFYAINILDPLIFKRKLEEFVKRIRIVKNFFFVWKIFFEHSIFIRLGL